MTTEKPVGEMNGTEVLQSLFNDIFELSPELIDISWTQEEYEVDGEKVFELSNSYFHLKEEFFESRLDDGDVFAKIHNGAKPGDHNYWSILSSHDILDLKKNTDLYNRIEVVDKHMLQSKARLLKELFGVNVRVVFSSGQFTITPLQYI